MKYDKQLTPYEGFFINLVIYFSALFVASFGAILARTVASIIIHTPSLADLKADAAYLFDRVYPVQAVFTVTGFLAGGFFCCYYIAYRIARKNGIRVDSFKLKMQIVPPVVAVSLINIGNGFVQMFTGIFGMQFWYPAAALTRLFGGMSNTNVLGEVSARDLMNNSFIYGTIAYKFVPQTLIVAVIECTAFGFLAYFGRKKGMERGLRARDKYFAELHGEIDQNNH